MSRQRFDPVNEASDSVIETGADSGGPGSGSGFLLGGSGSGFALGGSGEGSGWGRRRRGRRTPSTKSSSAETRLGCGKDGFRIIQNSNSGEAEQLRRLPLLLGERVWASGLTLWLSIERERERDGRGGFLGLQGVQSSVQ